jgi:sugar lactone lactonase YvrE
MLRILTTLAVLGAVAGVLVGRLTGFVRKEAEAVSAGDPAPNGLPARRDRGRPGDDLLRRLRRERRDLPRRPAHRQRRGVHPRRGRKAATGIELDRRSRLFVAGAGTGNAYVYNASTRALIRMYSLGSPPATFINDVVVTPKAAYFTDSQRAVLYRIPIGPRGGLGDARTIALAGDYSHVDGATNLNGIDATPSGKTLVAVQTVNGRLYRINPANGVATLIALGGESVPNGDGILLAGKTLYVVQNRLNLVAVIALRPGFASGRVVTRLSDSDFSVPTTIDDLGKRLYAVNARFGIPDPDTAAYQVAQLRKPGRH